MHSPILSGIPPESLFPDRSRMLRLLSLPTSEGRNPDRKLCDKFRYLEMIGILKVSMGIEPFRRFIDRSRLCRFVNFPKLTGIAPLRLVLYADS
jgi:hypothetical protein